jgi:hypothetical protein
MTKTGLLAAMGATTDMGPRLIAVYSSRIEAIDPIPVAASHARPAADQVSGGAAIQIHRVSEAEPMVTLPNMELRGPRARPDRRATKSAVPQPNALINPHSAGFTL